MTLLYLVRHAEQEHTPDERPSVGISVRGGQQALLLGQRLSGVPFDGIHHSPVPRAEETAQLVAESLPGVPVHSSAWLTDRTPFPSPEQEGVYPAPGPAELNARSERFAGQATVGRWSREHADSPGLPAPQDLEVTYAGPGDTERRVPLADLGRVALEGGRPARSFPSYRGQRNFPGRTISVVAAAAGLIMGLAACGGEDPSSGDHDGDGRAVAFNAGSVGIVNASDTKGGTLRFANPGEWDSLDTGDTYYGYSWNFARYYSRTLVTYKSAPGTEGAVLVPDLATDLGQSSEDAKTWTYTLKDGLKFADGTPITSSDVKYAVERQLDKETFPHGPTYFNDFLEGVPDGFSVYKGDSSNAIETPDDQTIVFHLNQAFSGFDYFAALPATAPVPKAKDTGTKYKGEYVSSGPYKFANYRKGRDFTLVRNDQWEASTDEVRPALPDSIEVALNVNPDDIDQRLMSGDLDVNVTNLGLGSAARAKVLTSPEQKNLVDSASSNRTRFTSINSEVAPFNNIDCRKAVIYGTDRTSYQTAFGGEIGGGSIATGLLPPTIPGQETFDAYPVSEPTGDVAKAKQALAACGRPNGFETSYSYRAELPAEKAAAESMQASLARVGITLTLKAYPQNDYGAIYAGKPAFAKKERLGLLNRPGQTLTGRSWTAPGCTPVSGPRPCCTGRIR